MKKATTNLETFYHFYPRNTVAIGAHFNGKTNLMAVAWNSPLSYKPPIFGVAIAEKRYTFHMITRSKAFSVNFLPNDKLDIMHAFGRTTGKEIDKIVKLNLQLEKYLKLNVPLLVDAYAAFECQLQDTRDYGDHTFFIGEVVAIHYDETLFDTEGIIKIEQVDPILYLGNNHYATSKRNSRIIKPQEVKL